MTFNEPLRFGRTDYQMLIAERSRREQLERTLSLPVVATDQMIERVERAEDGSIVERLREPAFLSRIGGIDGAGFEQIARVGDLMICRVLGGNNVLDVLKDKTLKVTRLTDSEVRLGIDSWYPAFSNRIGGHRSYLFTKHEDSFDVTGQPNGHLYLNANWARIFISSSFDDTRILNNEYLFWTYSISYSGSEALTWNSASSPQLDCRMKVNGMLTTAGANCSFAGIVRVIDGDNYYIFRRQKSNPSLTIVRREGGTGNIIASVNPTLPYDAAYDLDGEISGNALTLYHNNEDTPRLSATDSTHPNAGPFGIHLGDGTANSSFYVYQVDLYVEEPPPPSATARKLRWLWWG